MNIECLKYINDKEVLNYLGPLGYKLVIAYNGRIDKTYNNIPYLTYEILLKRSI